MADRGISRHILKTLLAGGELTSRELAVQTGCSRGCARKMLLLVARRHPEIRSRPEDWQTGYAAGYPASSWFWLPSTETERKES